VQGSQTFGPAEAAASFAQGKSAMFLDSIAFAAGFTMVNRLTEHDVDWGAIMATGMLLAAAPTLFAFLAARQIISGMTAGAARG